MTFHNILICNFSASIMVLLTLLIRKAAKYRVPNSVFCLLWIMIGVRLLFPIQIRTPMSILNVYFHFRNKPVLMGSIQGSGMRAVSLTGQIGAVSETAEGHGSIMVALWLVGCSIAVIHFIKDYFGDRKDMNDSELLGRIEWLELCIAKQKIRRKISFRIKDGLGSPVTWGVIKPTIFFPADFDFEDREFSEAILMHECGHIKYFHFVFKLWNMALTALYWYNPIVWIMYLKFERDLEISVDRYALRHTENITKDVYANILIAVAEKNKANKTTVSCFCKDRETRERVIAIMKYKKMGVGAIIATLLIPMGMTTVFASTNIVMSKNDTDLVVTIDINEVEMEEVNIEENGTTLLSVDWNELQQYVVDNDKSRAASYLIIENYEYVVYGRIPPKTIDVTTTVDGHKYSGTLTRGDYTYKASTNQYTGYYSGKIYLDD